MKIKSQKGVTLVSVIIYIIGMVIMATVIGTITIYFYNNLTKTSDVSKASIEYSKFNTFFLNDVKEQNNRLVRVDDNKLIQFSNGASYLYENNTVYRGDVRICGNVSDFTIAPNTQDEKQVIEILMEIEGRVYTTSYVVGTGY